MNWTKKSDHYQPVFWVNGYPCYVTTLLLGLHVLTMLAVVAMQSFGKNYLLNYLEFSSYALFHHGHIWPIFTYAFVNEPSLWFVWNLFVLFWFGPEVEKFVGGRSFGLFYLSQLVLVPLLLSGLALFHHHSTFAGLWLLHTSVFMAFVTIYPRVEILFHFQARWVAVITLGIYVLQCLASRAWVPLALLLCSVSWAYAFMRWLGVDGGSSWFSEWWTNRQFERAAQRHHLRIVREQDLQHDTDEILEKISKHGLTSLSATERRVLEQARASLLEKEQNK